MKKQRWKIGELAKLAGLTVRTLQYYDQIGLFTPSGHSESRRRLYTESDITRLQQILSLKQLGLSLDEIISVLAGDHISLLDIVTLQIARIKKNMIVEQKLLQELGQLSSQMRSKSVLTVENFTNLLETMRMSHEKFLVEKREYLNVNFDRLGEYLDKNPEQ